MKKLMLIAAVMIASVSAHASKARLEALQGAAHISDFQQTVQSKPEEAVNYEAATVEFGSATGTPNAEGGFIRKMGDAAWGLYLGRNSTTYAAGAAAVATGIGANADETAALNSAFAQDNSLQLTYAAKAGALTWGAGLFYIGNDFKNSTAYASNAENVTGVKTQNIMGVLLGVNGGAWDAQLRQGLVGTTAIKDMTANTIAAIAGATKLELNSTNATKISGGYHMDTMYVYGSVDMTAGEVKADGVKGVDSESSVTTVGVVNSHKKDGMDFFYGASAVITTSKEKVSGSKTDSTIVPLLVGVEAEVNSWLTLRGALSQNLGLLSTTKSSGGKAGSTTNSTTSTFGAGFKWGKADIDAILGVGGTGSFGLDSGARGTDGTGAATDNRTNNFAHMSVTYTF
jgi:hypothetical protein